MSEYDNAYEGWYCEQCDQSYAEDDVVVVPVDGSTERYACPEGHMQPGVYFSDTFYRVGLYLLSVADDDVWPELSPFLGYANEADEDAAFEAFVREEFGGHTGFYMNVDGVDAHVLAAADMSHKTREAIEAIIRAARKSVDKDES